MTLLEKIGRTFLRRNGGRAKGKGDLRFSVGKIIL